MSDRIRQDMHSTPLSLDFYYAPPAVESAMQAAVRVFETDELANCQLRLKPLPASAEVVFHALQNL